MPNKLPRADAERVAQALHAMPYSKSAMLPAVSKDDLSVDRLIDWLAAYASVLKFHAEANVKVRDERSDLSRQLDAIRVILAD